MADAFVRIGDPERSAATERLEGHLRAGRITPEDFKRRVQRIATCRTVRDLDQVMVGFQHIAPQPELADLGGGGVNGIVGSVTGASAEVDPRVQAGPGWYEVVDPWDQPLGQSPLTLRKARRIGWVLAFAISFFTAAPISYFLPSALEALVIFSPMLLMLVVSFWMAPNEKTAYRWVASPQDGKLIPAPSIVSEPANPAIVSGVGTPVVPAIEEPIQVPPPGTPVVESGVDQPTPWTVDGPTFPTVGETHHTPFDQDESAEGSAFGA